MVCGSEHETEASLVNAACYGVWFEVDARSERLKQIR
jgi:hypothetical protein